MFSIGIVPEKEAGRHKIQKDQWHRQVAGGTRKINFRFFMSIAEDHVAAQSETVSVLAERFYRGEWPNKVTVREGAQKWTLEPRLDLRAHSSTGFAWGNSGASAHQLALALLSDALQDDARAGQLHHDFCARVVAILPERWTITRSRIVAHATSIEARRRGAANS